MQDVRSEEEVLQSIGAWLAGEDAVRLALLTGSRGATRGRVDALSDYDVMLFLRPDAQLDRRDDWIRSFGSVLLTFSTSYELLGQRVPTRLVQYGDGLRIDFSLCPLELLQQIGPLLPESLGAGYRVLVDKDGDAARLPPASGAAWVPPPPSPERFAALVDEFWWESLYVARNLARGDALAARFSAEAVLRFQCLVPMLGWYVQRAHGWSQPLGPNGRGLAELLCPEDRLLLDRSAAGADLAGSWDALFAAAALFELAARSVAADLGYEYPEALAARVQEFARGVRQDAQPGGAES